MKQDITIGDAIQEMRKLNDASIDALITDPPYCSGGHSEARRRRANVQGVRSSTEKKKDWFINDNMGTAGLVWLLRSMMIEAERILKPGGSALVFVDWRMITAVAPALESSGMKFQNMIVWNKGSMGLGKGFRPQHEMILHYVKGTGQFYAKNVANVITEKRVFHGHKLHQAEKPVGLLRKLIQVVTEPGMTVLDPFAGSGATGQACREKGRKFIGVEKSGKIAQVAIDRI